MKVYADFNGVREFSEESEKCYLNLTGYGTLASLSYLQIQLTEGMALTLYDTDGLEVNAVVFYDKNKSDQENYKTGWFAKFDGSKIKNVSFEIGTHEKHLCFKCRKDLKPHLLDVGRQYNEVCPYCGTTVLFPLLPPDEVLT